jgi:acetylornithine/N-succinyldiaminopimelate aminotransferase
MKAKELVEIENQVLLGTYLRPDFVISHGKGAYLYDSEDTKYLDFVSGIAVNAFGHSDEQSQKVLAEQASKLWHCSNLYHTKPQVELAKLLVDNTFADKAFFCNSGTEAVEAAIKFARKWGRANKGDEAIEIISMNKSFHGRTYGALSATGQPTLQDGFQPMLPGFSFADFNDLESVKEKMTTNVCAVIVEPVQGEGGIIPADEAFITGLRKVCDERKVLLILDEIQCGFGRTGVFCAYENYGVTPDMMTSAKPIAAGLPLGAVLMTDDVAKNIKPGDHGTTFGGGPIVSAVATDVLERILEPNLLRHVREMGAYFAQQLKVLQSNFKQINEVRGKGLMLAISLNVEPKKVIDACAKQGLLICKTGGDAVRFLPPLNVTKKQIDEGIVKLKTALSELGD